MSTRVLLTNNQSPGDILMLTAAVKDLRTAHPRIKVNVKTSCEELWQSNPYLDLSLNENNAQVISAEYKLIHQSSQLPYHFIHGFRKDLEKKLNLSIPSSTNIPSVFFSKEEASQRSIIENMGYAGPYWVINCGGKKDYTAKWWNPDHAQAVVDHYNGKILFVQAGATGEDHWHPKLRGVVDLVGKTNLRQLMHLIHNSDGVICPVTMMMHLSAAIPSKRGGIRPCIVTAGGREPPSWEAYNGHEYISKIGQIPCAAGGACWKSKATQLFCKQESNGDTKLNSFCDNTVEVDYSVDEKPLLIPKCLHDIGPNRIINLIDSMIENKRIQYGKQSKGFRKSNLSRG